MITPEDQWARFTEDVPADAPPALSRAHFEDWAARYLDCDPESRIRTPPGVRIS